MEVEFVVIFSTFTMRGAPLLLAFLSIVRLGCMLLWYFAQQNDVVQLTPNADNAN